MFSIGAEQNNLAPPPTIGPPQGPMSRPHHEERTNARRHHYCVYYTPKKGFCQSPFPQPTCLQAATKKPPGLHFVATKWRSCCGFDRCLKNYEVFFTISSICLYKSSRLPLLSMLKSAFSFKGIIVCSVSKL